MRNRNTLLWFLAWTLPGFLLPVGLLGFIPIGALIVWPAAAGIAALLLIRRRRIGPEVLGVFVGLASWGFVFAWLNGIRRRARGLDPLSVEELIRSPLIIVPMVLVLAAVLGAAVWHFMTRNSAGPEGELGDRSTQ